MKAEIHIYNPSFSFAFQDTAWTSRFKIDDRWKHACVHARLNMQAHKIVCIFMHESRNNDTLQMRKNTLTLCLEAGAFQKYISCKSEVCNILAYILSFLAYNNIKFPGLEALGFYS